MPRALALDLGTTGVKAAVVDSAGAVSRVARVELTTSHPASGRAEQDATTWWRACVDAVAAVGMDAAPDVIAFSAARETFVAVDDGLEPLAPAILWSDRRATAELAAFGDPTGHRDRTGTVLDAGSTAVKLEWLGVNAPALVAGARWFLGPRDLVVARMTGRVATDATTASRTGCYDLELHLLERLDARYAAKLPPVRAPSSVVGGLLPHAAGQLGLPGGIPVVLGAGDRPCEVVGTGATESTPMVSWGTTANLSVPVERIPPGLVPGIVWSRGARDGFLLEQGQSAAGAAIAAVAGACSATPAELYAEASTAPPGSAGLLAFPWFGGARAPWWRADTEAALVGWSPHHTRAHLARAVIEGVAFDVARGAERLPVAPRAVVLAGGGADQPAWIDAASAAVGCEAVVRTHGDAALVGAAIIGFDALGAPVDVEVLNPVARRHPPDPATLEALARGRVRHDAVARALLDDAVARALLDDAVARARLDLEAWPPPATGEERR